ncbi:unnamed protein product, partial [Ixodes persulcatus]
RCRRPRAAQGRAVGTLNGRSEIVVAGWWRRRTSSAPPSKEPDPRGPGGGEEGAGRDPRWEKGTRRPGAGEQGGEGETGVARRVSADESGATDCTGDGRLDTVRCDRQRAHQSGTRDPRRRPFVRSATSWWCARRPTPGASSTRRGISGGKTQRLRPAATEGDIEAALKLLRRERPELLT